MVRRGVLIACLLSAVAAQNHGAESAEPRSLRVYFIGNSVTETVDPEGLEKLAASRGYKHTWGRHVTSGASLGWIAKHPQQGDQQSPFGRFPEALSNHPWDAVCLQPFDRYLNGEDGDVAATTVFITLALANSPDAQIYIFARWPRKDRDRELYFDRQWSRQYRGDWDSTNETRDYFECLVAELRRSLPEMKKPVRIIPVGHVLHEMDRRIEAGEVPGLRLIDEFYEDAIHLNHLGSYVAACTFFATLYGQSPRGLPTEPYGRIDPELADVIHETVWKVVATHELSGVTAAVPPSYARRSISRSATARKAKKRPAPTAEQPQPRPISRDERYRRLAIGTWGDNFQGKRTMTLKEDGTGTMIVELSGMKAALFAKRLEFNMVWSVKNGRLKKRTLSGEPAVRVNMILKTMGDRVDEPILELTKDRMLLLDKDGETKYDWRRKK